MADVQLPPVPKVMRVVYRSGFTLAPQTWTNTMHFGYTGTINEETATNLAQHFGAQWRDSILPRLSHLVTLNTVRVKDLDHLNGAGAEAEFGNLGGSGSTVMPLGSCLVISERTNHDYRGGHSRIYVSGIAPADIGTADTLDATPLAAWRTAVADWKATSENPIDAGVTGVGMVSVQYYSGFEVITSPSGRAVNRPKLATTPRIDGVNTLYTHQTLGSQRRRNHFK